MWVSRVDSRRAQGWCPNVTGTYTLDDGRTVPQKTLEIVTLPLLAPPLVLALDGTDLQTTGAVA